MAPRTTRNSARSAPAQDVNALANANQGHNDQADMVHNALGPDHVGNAPNAPDELIEPGNAHNASGEPMNAGNDAYNVPGEVFNPVNAHVHVEPPRSTVGDSVANQTVIDGHVRGTAAHMMTAPLTLQRTH